MDETPTPSANPASAPPPPPPPAAAAAAQAMHAHGHGLAYSLLAVFLAALAFGGWGLWTVFAPRPGDVRAQLSAQRERIATLTQNVNRGAVNDGRLTLALEGSRGGRMEKLQWEALRQQADAPGIDYSFKYFQQVQGDVMVPAGLQPVRVVVRLAPAHGEPVEQSFTWAEATADPAP
jgi:hypothetical protein